MECSVGSPPGSIHKTSSSCLQGKLIRRSTTVGPWIQNLPCPERLFLTACRDSPPLISQEAFFLLFPLTRDCRLCQIHNSLWRQGNSGPCWQSKYQMQCAGRFSPWKDWQCRPGLSIYRIRGTNAGLPPEPEAPLDRAMLHPTFENRTRRVARWQHEWHGHCPIE